MSIQNTLYNATVKGMRKLSSTRMDLPDNELRTELIQAKVTATNDLAPNLRRITLTHPMMETFTPSGADEYIGIIMPLEGQALIMPDPQVSNIRAAIRAIPEQQRPNLRWYTVRAVRKEVAEIDVDVVTHGRSGPGSIWALGVQPGDEVGIRFIGSCHYPHSDAQLYLADATAVPAMLAILETFTPEELALTHVIRVAPSADYLEPVDFDPRLASCTLLEASPVNAPAAITEVLRCPPFTVSELNYAWLCGESSVATMARRILTKDHHMDKKKIFFSGYWKLGAARS